MPDQLNVGNVDVLLSPRTTPVVSHAVITKALRLPVPPSPCLFLSKRGLGSAGLFSFLRIRQLARTEPQVKPSCCRPIRARYRGNRERIREAPARQPPGPPVSTVLLWSVGIEKSSTSLSVPLNPSIPCHLHHLHLHLHTFFVTAFSPTCMSPPWLPSFHLVDPLPDASSLPAVRKFSKPPLVLEVYRRKLPAAGPETPEYHPLLRNQGNIYQLCYLQIINKQTKGVTFFPKGTWPRNTFAIVFRAAEKRGKIPRSLRSQPSARNPAGPTRMV